MRMGISGDELIAEIERHRDVVRRSDRELLDSTARAVRSLLVRAAEPMEEVREMMHHLERFHAPGGCSSVGQANAIGREIREIMNRLDALHAQGGPHEALLGLIIVAYRKLTRSPWDRPLQPEEDEAITEALRRYAAAEA